MSTVAAISTGKAPGGIGIVRISGENAISIADKVFSSFNGKKLSDLSGYSALYGKAFDENGNIDNVVALVFKAPKSYTGEDVVEISCHGGLFVTDKVLKAVLDAGAIPAEAGEFTKRAFLNGKMDLTSAESVMNIISAQGEQAEKIALGVLEGRLFKEIKKINDKLVYDMALLSAWVDYPYEEIEDLSENNLKEHIDESIEKLEKLINDFSKGQIIMEGVDTAIVGCPNVGKSTLMNSLSGTEKSIVTEIAGTTRDIVEAEYEFNGIIFRLYDTAGIHESDDIVEQIGIDRAKQAIEDCDLVLKVSTPDQKCEIETDKPYLNVFNKSDLLNKKDADNYIYVSAVKNENIDSLKQAIFDKTVSDNINQNKFYLTNTRHIEAVRLAVNSLKTAVEIFNNTTFDIISSEIKTAWSYLGEISGVVSDEAILDKIFSKFCLGK